MSDGTDKSNSNDKKDSAGSSKKNEKKVMEKESPTPSNNRSSSNKLATGSQMKRSSDHEPKKPNETINSSELAWNAADVKPYVPGGFDRTDKYPYSDRDGSGRDYLPHQRSASPTERSDDDDGWNYGGSYSERYADRGGGSGFGFGTGGGFGGERGGFVTTAGRGFGGGSVTTTGGFRGGSVTTPGGGFGGGFGTTTAGWFPRGRGGLGTTTVGGFGRGRGGLGNTTVGGFGRGRGGLGTTTVGGFGRGKGGLGTTPVSGFERGGVGIGAYTNRAVNPGGGGDGRTVTSRGGGFSRGHVIDPVRHRGHDSFDEDDDDRLMSTIDDTDELVVLRDDDDDSNYYYKPWLDRRPKRSAKQKKECVYCDNASYPDQAYHVTEDCPTFREFQDKEKRRFGPHNWRQAAKKEAAANNSDVVKSSLVDIYGVHCHICQDFFSTDNTNSKAPAQSMCAHYVCVDCKEAASRRSQSARYKCGLCHVEERDYVYGHEEPSAGFIEILRAIHRHVEETIKAQTAKRQKDEPQGSSVELVDEKKLSVFDVLKCRQCKVEFSTDAKGICVPAQVICGHFVCMECYEPRANNNHVCPYCDYTNPTNQILPAHGFMGLIDELVKKFGKDCKVTEGKQFEIEVMETEAPCSKCTTPTNINSARVCATCSPGKPLCLECVVEGHHGTEHVLHKYAAIKRAVDIKQSRDKFEPVFDGYRNLFLSTFGEHKAEFHNLYIKFQFAYQCMEASKDSAECPELIIKLEKLVRDFEESSEQFMPELRKYLNRNKTIFKEISEKFPKDFIQNRLKK